MILETGSKLLKIEEKGTFIFEIFYKNYYMSEVFKNFHSSYTLLSSSLHTYRFYMRPKAYFYCNNGLTSSHYALNF